MVCCSLISDKYTVSTGNYLFNMKNMLYASQNVTFITKVQDICIAMMQIITLFLVTAIIVDSHDNMKWQVRLQVEIAVNN